MERIIEQEDIELGMSELAELYNLVSHGSHRFLFKHKPGEAHPILKTTKNNTNWKKRFFFVRRDSIPDGKDLPIKWATHAISVSHIIPSPATEERITAFWNLDPAVRSFQANTKNSQEVSLGSVTMSSDGKSSKSASRFSVSDLSNVGPGSAKKKAAASPSTIIPKLVTSKGERRGRPPKLKILKACLYSTTSLKNTLLTNSPRSRCCLMHTLKKPNRSIWSSKRSPKPRIKPSPPSKKISIWQKGKWSWHKLMQIK
ncbi:hypothetical protein HanRHA438_Chr09g0380531 [Helianthus annuus]|nr:hypothetical protein HanRHA438_Chr09g0380531 [Helianthus annuus]